MSNSELIYQSGALFLQVDTNEEDPKEVFMAECRSCSATSDVVEDTRLPVEVWTVGHARTNPGHNRFRLTTDTSWRVSRAGRRRNS